MKYFILLFMFAQYVFAQVNPVLPAVELSIGKHKLKAEVAANEQTRSTGLMNRFSLAPESGMVFVFEQPQPLAFWMRNTHIPLSIAYIDAKGKIINIEDMQPLNENTVASKGLAQFALEMKQGWFKDKGIKAGDLVLGLEQAQKLK